MNKNKIIKIGFLILIFIIILIIIVFTPNKKESFDIFNQKIPTLKELDLEVKLENIEMKNNNKLKISEEKLRDIFSFESELDVKKINKVESFKKNKFPKINGVFLSDGIIKSIILDGGQILNEGERMNGFIINKISEEEVIITGENGENRKINIWGDNQ